MNPADPLLRFRHVEKNYGAVQALHDIDFSMGHGSIGLLGPNGAGKSTLLKILIGLLDFDGEAEILGCDVRADSLRLRSLIGYMPERDCYLPQLNAVELCSYAAQLAGLPKADALQRTHVILDFVGLGDKRYQKIGGFSTGQKQRVKLASALVHGPQLLLLDEPTNGLDPDGRDEMLGLIADFSKRSGCSTILSTHLLHDVEKICDSALLIYRGRLQFRGALDELKRPQTSRAFEVRVKVAPEKMSAALKARGCQVSQNGERLTVEVPADIATPSRFIFETAAQAELQVRHFLPSQMSLESAFLQVVNDADSVGTAR